MLKEEKKIGNKRRFICSILVILISVLFSGNIFADLIIEEYFLDLKPENHVKSIYSNDKKDELKKEEVHYDDIENLIHLFNPEILNNWNNWENNKSAQDIYDNYQSAADKLYNSASSQDSDLQEAMLGAQGIAMQIQADKNASDSYTNFLTNYLIEKQLVLQTKIIDLNYQKSAYELIKANDALEEARNNKIIGSSQEAHVYLQIKDENVKKVFEKFTKEELQVLFVVSEVSFEKNEESNEYDVSFVSVKHHEGNRCDRCWNYSKLALIQEDGTYLCPRCQKVINK